MRIEEKPVKIAIFFHEDLPEEKRKYWIGTVDSKDIKLCNTVLKRIKGKGKEALKEAIDYISWF